MNYPYQHPPQIDEGFEAIIDFILAATDHLEEKDEKIRNSKIFDVEPINRLKKFERDMDGILPEDPFREAADNMNMSHALRQEDEIFEKRLIIGKGQALSLL